MRTIVVLGVLPLLGCVATTSKLGVATSGEQTSSGQVTIPNVFKMKKDEAIAALRRAGVQGDISEDSSLCGSVVDGRVIEQGEVCYQHPPAGRVQGSRLVVSIRVQSENPRRGNIGTHNEWRLMPNVVGMTADKARAEMKRAGFEREDRVSVMLIDEPGCKPMIVCRTHPDPMERAGLNDGKLLYAGVDPDARPAATAASPRRAVETPASAAPETATSVASRREPESAAPKAEPMPEGFFTVPSDPPTPAPSPTPAPPPRPAPTATPTPTSASSTAEVKRWGGNGAAPYRDEANVPQGPGGPVYLGKGPPCTDKVDHCLRPGVWFAVDDVVAGRQYRASPVFEFENKWWTWRGEEASYKMLFKTKVVEKSSELAPGSPVVWLVLENPRRKWLVSEHDALTTSRWTSGVIDSVTNDSVRVKGWPDPIVLDMVRVVVETKTAQ